FADRNFANWILEDLMVKKYINTRHDNAGLEKAVIPRAPKKVTVDIHTSRPGIVIGRKGSEVDILREELQLLTKKDISLNIIEVKKPELNARLVADSIAHQLEGRIAYRRAMKRAMMTTMKMGADGIKILCSGRLAGAEIARSEKYMQGRVPLHTLRADIDYATSTAHTTYGTIGVKVWICRGMVMGVGEMEAGEDTSKGTPERPEIEMGGKKDRRKRDAARRNRRPRGRVRRPDQRGDNRGGPGGPRGGGAPRSNNDGRRPARPSGPPNKQSAPKDARNAGPKTQQNKPAAKKAEGPKKSDSPKSKDDNK
ncbi:MAG: 30S ribosomal protein S3, partial [bacterium]|nr:30S ribosomal protein S3 [bacterium]